MSDKNLKYKEKNLPNTNNLMEKIVNHEKPLSESKIFKDKK